MLLLTITSYSFCVTTVFQVSGKPIKFVGTGEKMESLEPFYPERMASRILGQGDVLSLYEKAEQAIKVRWDCPLCTGVRTLFA